MNIPPFRVILPRVRRSAAIFSSSHSGREYDAGFLKQSQLSVQDLRSLEDAYVDRLFDTAPTCGAPLICGTAPRAYVDLNRQPDELDPKLIDGVHELQSTPRVRRLRRHSSRGKRRTEHLREEAVQGGSRSKIGEILLPVSLETEIADTGIASKIRLGDPL